MKIQILIDNPNSWIIPHTNSLVSELRKRNHEVKTLQNHSEVLEGDILVLLSCEKKFTKLHLNRNNLVVHESALPLGRGWSPLTWQVLEGKKEIPVTLFEAADEIDAGNIYLSTKFSVLETDLIEDLRQKQATATTKLILDYVDSYPITGRQQIGTPTYYKKRTPKDSQLDPAKTLKELWPSFQVADNDRYPCFVEINGQKFSIRISKM